MYILTKIRAAALAFAGFAPYFGTQTQNAFRWYDTQLQQGSAFPAMVATVISNPSDYTFLGRMPTSLIRVQFTIWAYDPVQMDAIVEQLFAFLAGFNAYGYAAPVATANFVVNDSGSKLYAETQPPQYWRVIDVKIFNNDTV